MPDIALQQYHNILTETNHVQTIYYNGVYDVSLMSLITELQYVQFYLLLEKLENIARVQSMATEKYPIKAFVKITNALTFTQLDFWTKTIVVD